MTDDYGNLELHKILLAALKDFDALCRKHRLRYILHGGSCLGAIRHKGFIPWDDDVDIAMPRKDYEAFLKIAPKEFGDRYGICTYKTDPDMLTNVMKISILGSGFQGVSGAKDKGEAFLDVFPMSDVPNSKWGQKIQNRIAIFLNQIVYTKIGYIKLESLKAKILLGTLSKLPRRFLGDLVEWNCKRFPHFHARHVDIVATANYNGNTGYAWDLLPKKYLTELVETDFEGERFYITKYWDEYLSSRYGDYMTPPPMEKRVNKHQLKKID